MNVMDIKVYFPRGIKNFTLATTQILTLGASSQINSGLISGLHITNGTAAVARILITDGTTGLIPLFTADIPANSSYPINLYFDLRHFGGMQIAAATPSALVGVTVIYNQE